MHADNRHPQIKGLQIRDNEGQEMLYGRRVELDRSWTVYHVFTGVPAGGGCGAMTGLSRAGAAEKMMSLNRHSHMRRGARSSSLHRASTRAA
mgnify:CR=1 FL=1